MALIANLPTTASGDGDLCSCVIKSTTTGT
jgi:hypothetical protein